MCRSSEQVDSGYWGAGKTGVHQRGKLQDGNDKTAARMRSVDVSQRLKQRIVAAAREDGVRRGHAHLEGRERPSGASISDAGMPLQAVAGTSGAGFPAFIDDVHR